MRSLFRGQKWQEKDINSFLSPGINFWCFLSIFGSYINHRKSAVSSLQILQSPPDSTQHRLQLSDQFSYLDNRARYEFIELGMSTGLDKQIELRKPSSIRVYRSRYINRPRWTNRPRETVLDMSIPSSNCRGRWSKDSHFSGGTSRMLSSSISLTIALEFS